MDSRITISSLCLLVLLASSQGLCAQSPLPLGQYPELLSYSNPGSIATTHTLNLRVAYSWQQTGADTHTPYYLALADMPVRALGREHGVGLVASTQRLGAFRDSELGLRYALPLSLGRGRLQIGFGLSYVHTSYRPLEATNIPPTPIEGKGVDASLGLYYQHPGYWITLSTGSLLAPTLIKHQAYQRGRIRFYTIGAGYHYRLRHSRWSLAPSLLGQIDASGDYRLAGRLELWYADRVQISALYRHREAIGSSIGLRLGSVYLGYQYEHPVGREHLAHRAGHELMLGYTLPIDLAPSKPKRYKSIRLL